MFKAGAGTNTQVELLALWCLLSFARHLDLHHFSILGTSHVIIDWASDRSRLQSLSLQHWCMRTRTLITAFSYIDFNHIYRCHNQVADSLSKLALGIHSGLLIYKEFRANMLVLEGTLDMDPL